MSLDISQLSLGPLETNCYAVRATGSSEAIVIDPSGDVGAISAQLAEWGVPCSAILITHGHWDHLGAVADLAEATGAPVHMAADERHLLEEVERFVPGGIAVRPWTPEVLLVGDERLEVAGIGIDTLRVPGHSPAHLAYAADGVVFSGDVLFAGSVGRTDLPGADWPTLLSSIRLLAERLPPETIVYSGHGPPTTIGGELGTNPFLAELRAPPRP
ncbi:MAG: MBL fold metallo-hydrolase [Gaiellales bacterium]